MAKAAYLKVFRCLCIAEQSAINFGHYTDAEIKRRRLNIGALQYINAVRKKLISLL